MEIDLNNFYSSLVAIFIIIAVGFLLGKIKWIDEGANKKIVNLLLMVFMPITLFNAFPGEYSEEYGDLFVKGMVGGAVVMLMMIVVAKLIYNKKFFPGELHSQSQFAFIFNNAAFLGYPIISTAFGERGVVPYCGFIIMFNLALFSYGVWLFEHKISMKFFVGTITNPNIIAVLLGLLLFVLKVELPGPVENAVGYLANVTTPLSLICVGYMLSEAKLRELWKSWRLFIIAASQLILAPVITFAVLNLMGFPQEVVIVCTLIQALPTATSLGLFAEKYGGGKGEATASELVVISTLLSMATLPLVVMIFLR